MDYTICEKYVLFCSLFWTFLKLATYSNTVIHLAFSAILSFFWPFSLNPKGNKVGNLVFFGVFSSFFGQSHWLWGVDPDPPSKANEFVKKKKIFCTFFVSKFSVQKAQKTRKFHLFSRPFCNSPPSKKGVFLEKEAPIALSKSPKMPKNPTTGFKKIWGL